jgi:hypothetical protein
LAEKAEPPVKRGPGRPRVPKPPKRPPGRPKLPNAMIKINLYIEKQEYERLKEIARVESIAHGKPIGALFLIREAVNYIYRDEMRLRDMFRRYRTRSVRRLMNLR